MNAPNASKRAVIYVRVSVDRDDQTCTDSQERTARSYAESKGWEVIDVESDKGRSAYEAETHCPGIDRVFDEVGSHHGGATVVSQDLTVFNLTSDAVVARQAVVDDSPAPVHGTSRLEPGMEEPHPPPAWFADALFDR